MITVDTFAGARSRVAGTVALVPTMGYLHEGHLSLISAAADLADTTVVSLFVNPTQFGDPADLDIYPRDPSRDAALAEGAGADVLFTPAIEEVYPSAATTVRVDGVSDEMEGRFRPGHFEGVATVVAKLFGGIQPDIALFGKKDAQQLAVIRTMTSDLRLPVRVLGRPTVREEDGLALSSRNKNIAPEYRRDARSLSQALFAAADCFEEGDRDAGSLIEATAGVLRGYPSVTVEYVELADAFTARQVSSAESDSFLAVAAVVGGVRLIDNVAFDMEHNEVDRGVTLDRPSILYKEG